MNLLKGIVLELFRIKDRKGFSLGLVSIAVIILLSSIVAIGGRDEVLLRSDLSIPERSFYTFMPYFLPFGVLMTLLTVYDFAFPRVLKITLDGVRSRFWKLSWSEITDASMPSVKPCESSALDRGTGRCSVSGIVGFHVCSALRFVF